jgi:hypothetical protein
MNKPLMMRPRTVESFMIETNNFLWKRLLDWQYMKPYIHKYDTYYAQK